MPLYHPNEMEWLKPRERTEPGKKKKDKEESCKRSQRTRGWWVGGEGPKKRKLSP